MNFRQFFELNDARQGTVEVYHRTGSPGQLKTVFQSGFKAFPSHWGRGVPGAFFSLNLDEWDSQSASDAYGSFMVAADLQLQKIAVEGQVAPKFGLPSSIGDQILKVAQGQEIESVLKKNGIFDGNPYSVFSPSHEKAPLFEELGFNGIVFRGKSTSSNPWWVMVFRSGIPLLKPTKWMSGSGTMEWKSPREALLLPDDPVVTPTRQKPIPPKPVEVKPQPKQDDDWITLSLDDE